MPVICMYRAALSRPLRGPFPQPRSPPLAKLQKGGGGCQALLLSINSLSLGVIKPMRAQLSGVFQASAFKGASNSFIRCFAAHSQSLVLLSLAVWIHLCLSSGPAAKHAQEHPLIHGQGEHRCFGQCYGAQVKPVTSPAAALPFICAYAGGGKEPRHQTLPPPSYRLATEPPAKVVSQPRATGTPHPLLFLTLV